MFFSVGRPDRSVLQKSGLKSSMQPVGNRSRGDQNWVLLATVPPALSLHRLHRGHEESLAIIDGSEVLGKDQRDDGLQLHHNVQSWARGVLERIADGVSSHGGIMRRHLLALQRCVVWETTTNVFLTVIPSAS